MKCVVEELSLKPESGVGEKSVGVVRNQDKSWDTSTEYFLHRKVS